MSDFNKGVVFSFTIFLLGALSSPWLNQYPPFSWVSNAGFALGWNFAKWVST